MDSSSPSKNVGQNEANSEPKTEDDKFIEKVTKEETLRPTGAVLDEVMKLMAKQYLSEKERDEFWITDTSLFETLEKNKKTNEIMNFDDNHRSREENRQNNEILQNNLKEVKKLNNDSDLFMKRYLIFPINLENHWILVVVADPTFIVASRKDSDFYSYMIFYDPMGYLTESRRQHVEHILKQYLYFESYQNYGTGCEFVRLKRPSVKNIPIQSNLIDCSAYICRFLCTIFLEEYFTYGDLMNLDWPTMYPNGEEYLETYRKVTLIMIENVAAEKAYDRLMED